MVLSIGSVVVNPYDHIIGVLTNSFDVIEGVTNNLFTFFNHSEPLTVTPSIILEDFHINLFDIIRGVKNNFTNPYTRFRELRHKLF
jgi:hypothetical protein